MEANCRKEAARDAAKEPLLSSFMYASILSHDNFLECLAFVLANRMSNPTTLATEYFDAFMSTFTDNDELVQSALDDLQAVRERVQSYINLIDDLQHRGGSVLYCASRKMPS